MTDGSRNDSIALINGVIYPMTQPGHKQALFARGGVIEAIGGDREILSLCTSKTVVLDMKGGCVLPGFTDTHVQLLAAGRTLESLDLSGVRSIEELITAGRRFLAENEVGENCWFYAHGWDQNHMSERRYPNRFDLDRISTDIPLFFERCCGHVAALNTPALKILKIGTNFRVAGGVVLYDEEGEPNGVIGESALNRARRNIPKSGVRSLRRWYDLAVEKMLRCGITAVQSDDFEMAGGVKGIFDFYERLDTQGKIPMRITQQWQIGEKELPDFIEKGNHRRNGRNFRSGPLKVRVDGTLGAGTAAMREGFSDDPGNCGVYAISQKKLNSLVRQAQEGGMQSALYAIGDGAIERCLNAVEAAKDAANADIAHRIVHCQIGGDDLYGRMAALGVMADIQPAFVASDWPIVVPRLDSDRARCSYAWRSLLKCGIPVGAGSDAPTEPFDPLIGIRAAILRQDLNNLPMYGWMPSQRLDRWEAIWIYTRGGAQICGELDWRGTLEPGKAADITAFAEDPFSVPYDEIPKMTVGLTVVDGKIRYIK